MIEPDDRSDANARMICRGWCRERSGSMEGSDTRALADWFKQTDRQTNPTGDASDVDAIWKGRPCGR